MTRNNKRGFGTVPSGEGPHRPGQGLDWNRIRREREAKMTPEEIQAEREASPFDEQGNLKTEVKLREAKAARAKQATANHRASRAKPKTEHKSPGVKGPRVADWEKFKDLYREGWTVPEIAELQGNNPDTVRHALTQMGVYDPSRDRGRGNRGRKGRNQYSD